VRFRPATGTPILLPVAAAAAAVTTRRRSSRRSILLSTAATVDVSTLVEADALSDSDQHMNTPSCSKMIAMSIDWC
jgi:uncharacterized protein (TIGR03382 family)